MRTCPLQPQCRRNKTSRRPRPSLLTGAGKYHRGTWPLSSLACPATSHHLHCTCVRTLPFPCQEPKLPHATARSAPDSIGGYSENSLNSISRHCSRLQMLLAPLPAHPSSMNTHPSTQPVTLTRDRNSPKPRATASSAASCRSSSRPRRRTITPAPGSRRQARVAATASASVVPRGAGGTRQNDLGGEKQNVPNLCMSCSLHPLYKQRIPLCSNRLQAQIL